MFRADTGVANGLVQAIGHGLSGTRMLDASGMLVMPGGVDTHCHIEQLRPDGFDASAFLV
jgi:dihydropyrimidinase